ncbi:MAG: hypothetical protein EOO75_16820 [Myxococcales bacterium]|nr:MAG: hypothetical protein EOO75_16820 [Myxococcales bacterium]
MGWLEREAAYSRGEVSGEFFEALVRLLVEPWQPFISAGRHRCSLCRFSGGPAQFTHGEHTVLVGVSNVFVPGNGVIYVAPSLVVHYIDAHGYRPPDGFIEAVLGCPPMGTMPYLRALKAIDGGALLRRRHGP